MTPTHFTGHTRKKPFQRSITSFFDSRDSSSSTLHSRKTATPLSPPLPDDTQASLISVGMRVRKSVPEGYKTHKTIPAQNVDIPDPTQLTSSSNTTTDTSGGSGRELMPFCGLHKVGGWAQQDVLTPPAPVAIRRQEGDDDLMPGLTSSQNTLSSTQRSSSSFGVEASTSGQKRAFEEEMEDDLDAYFDTIESLETLGQQQARSVRPIASIRRTAARAAVIQAASQPNNGDFEDAVFLTPMDTDDDFER